MKNIYLRSINGLLAVLFLFTLVTIPAPAFAATKAGVNPGSIFYAFDILLEKADLAFTFNKEKRVQKIITNTEERLAEAEDAAVESKPDAVEKAMSGYQNGISSAIVEAKNINDKEKTKELLSGISDNVSKQQDILTVVYDKVPEASKGAVKKAIAINTLEQEKATKEIVAIQAAIFSDQEGEAPKLQKETEKINIVENQEKDKEKKEIEVAPKPEKDIKAIIVPKVTEIIVPSTQKQVQSNSDTASGDSMHQSASSKKGRGGGGMSMGVIISGAHPVNPTTPATPATPSTNNNSAIPATPAIPAKPNSSSSSVSSISSSTSSISSSSSESSSSSVSSSVGTSSSSSSIATSSSSRSSSIPSSSSSISSISSSSSSDSSSSSSSSVISSYSSSVVSSSSSSSVSSPQSSSSSSAPQLEIPTQVSQFGSTCELAGITVKNGLIYVTEQSHQMSMEYTCTRVRILTTSGDVVRTIGNKGEGSGEFSMPMGIDVSSDGKIYVADDFSHNIVQIFSSDGTSTSWSLFSKPRGVAVGASGIYVADFGNDRIKKFDSNGNLLLQWGSYGFGNGQFNLPNDITIDGDGNVYVLETSSNRVQKFTAEGQFIWMIGFIGPYGANGSTALGYFSHPRGIGVDSVGNLYVADTENHRIQKFNQSGQFLLSWGSQGSGVGQFITPTDVAVDENGYIYVTSETNGIQKFK